MPLPVELSDSPDATVALYRAAITEAGVKPSIVVEPTDGGVYVGAITYADAGAGRAGVRVERRPDRHACRSPAAPPPPSACPPAAPLCCSWTGRAGGWLARTGTESSWRGSRQA